MLPFTVCLRKNIEMILRVEFRLIGFCQQKGADRFRYAPFYIAICKANFFMRLDATIHYIPCHSLKRLQLLSVHDFGGIVGEFRFFGKYKAVLFIKPSGPYIFCKDP